VNEKLLMMSWNLIQSHSVLICCFHLFHWLEDCTELGKCVGILLSEVESFGLADCQSKCEAYSGSDLDFDGIPETFCGFFTYNSAIQNCQFLDSCERLTEGCANCVSGSVQCTLELPNVENGNINIFFVVLREKSACSISVLRGFIEYFFFQKSMKKGQI